MRQPKNLVAASYCRLAEINSKELKWWFIQKVLHALRKLYWGGVHFR